MTYVPEQTLVLRGDSVTTLVRRRPGSGGKVGRLVAGKPRSEQAATLAGAARLARLGQGQVTDPMDPTDPMDRTESSRGGVRIHGIHLYIYTTLSPI